MQTITFSCQRCQKHVQRAIISFPRFYSNTAIQHRAEVQIACDGALAQNLVVENNIFKQKKRKTTREPKNFCPFHLNVNLLLYIWRTLKCVINIYIFKITTKNFNGSNLLIIVLSFKCIMPFLCLVRNYLKCLN